MKIGIYGGTFNPIHDGHINLIKGFYYRLKLDKIILIPSHTPPHKDAKMLASSFDRMNMCNLAVKDLDFCTVSDIELKRDGKSYTVDTLKQLKEIYPNDEFFLLMGEDMFLTVTYWKDSEEIFKLATIATAPRSFNGAKTLYEYGLKVQSEIDFFKFALADISYVEVSSTDVRCGKNLSIPDCVKKYINENKLYYLEG